jgi:hypothetical protein
MQSCKRRHTSGRRALSGPAHRCCPCAGSRAYHPRVSLGHTARRQIAWHHHLDLLLFGYECSAIPLRLWQVGVLARPLEAHSSELYWDSYIGGVLNDCVERIGGIRFVCSRRLLRDTADRQLRRRSALPISEPLPRQVLRPSTECSLNFQLIETGRMAPRARFELATLRLTAEEVKNLNALPGVAYEKLGAIFPSLIAPTPASTSMAIWAVMAILQSF